MAPWYTTKGWRQFTGTPKPEPKVIPKEQLERGYFIPTEFPWWTKTGHKQMMEKYGNPPKQTEKPLNTWEGIKEWIDWGDSFRFNSISEAPPYTRTFYEDIGFIQKP